MKLFYYSCLLYAVAFTISSAYLALAVEPITQPHLEKLKQIEALKKTAKNYENLGMSRDGKKEDFEKAITTRFRKHLLKPWIDWFALKC